MKVYRRATLNECRTSLDHRDADRVADDAAVGGLNKHRRSPNAHRHFAIRAAHRRVMRARSADLRDAAVPGRDRRAASTRYDPARRA